MSKDQVEEMDCCYNCDNLLMKETEDFCSLEDRLINHPDESCPPPWCPVNKNLNKEEPND